jgi:uncharacterized protein DUF547
MNPKTLIVAAWAAGLTSLCACKSSGDRVQTRAEAGHEPSAEVYVSSPAEATRAGSPSDFDELLHKYVRGEFVDYAGWKANAGDMERFDAFLRWQGDADPAAMSREEKIAFYVNAYNAACVKLILDHYPVHSPLDIDGFFDKEKHKFKVGGEMLSNPQIEYDRLVPLGDARAHFAIVCADRGCPPLRNAAYTGAGIDQELEAASQRFVSDKRNLVCDASKKELQVSKLFEWYGKDFTADSKRPAAKPELYLVNWAQGDCRSLLVSGDYAVKIIEWNWTLNEKR